MHIVGKGDYTESSSALAYIGGVGDLRDNGSFPDKGSRMKTIVAFIDCVS